MVRQRSYSPKSSPFLDEVRKIMRLKRMSRRNGASYLHYIIDFIRFRAKRHPRERGVCCQREAASSPWTAPSLWTMSAISTNAALRFVSKALRGVL